MTNSESGRKRVWTTVDCFDRGGGGRCWWPTTTTKEGRIDDFVRCWNGERKGSLLVVVHGRCWIERTSCVAACSCCSTRRMSSASSPRSWDCSSPPPPSTRTTSTGSTAVPDGGQTFCPIFSCSSFWRPGERSVHTDREGTRRWTECLRRTGLHFQYRIRCCCCLTRMNCEWDGATQGDWCSYWWWPQCRASQCPMGKVNGDNGVWPEHNVCSMPSCSKMRPCCCCSMFSSWWPGQSLNQCHFSKMFQKQRQRKGGYTNKIDFFGDPRRSVSGCVQYGLKMGETMRCWLCSERWLITE